MTAKYFRNRSCCNTLKQRDYPKVLNVTASALSGMSWQEKNSYSSWLPPIDRASVCMCIQTCTTFLNAFSIFIFVNFLSVRLKSSKVKHLLATDLLFKKVKWKEMHLLCEQSRQTCIILAAVIQTKYLQATTRHTNSGQPVIFQIFRSINLASRTVSRDDLGPFTTDNRR